MADENKKELYRYPFKEFKVLGVSLDDILLFDEKTGEERIIKRTEFDFLDKKISPKDVVRVYETYEGKAFYEVQLLNWWQEGLKNFWFLVTNGSKKAAKNIKEKAESIDTEKLKQNAMELKDKSVEFTQNAMDKIDTDKFKEKGQELKDNLSEKLPHGEKEAEENSEEKIEDET